MPTMYELTTEFKDVLAMASDPDIEPQAILDTLEAIQAPSVITPFAIFASVIPYPAIVVGLVPAVTCPVALTVTERYVPAVTPELA